MDWKSILEASKKVTPTTIVIQESAVNKNKKFAVAKDEAFNFIYPQNISAMEALGEVIYFSPLHDTQLPDCDFVYLAGGYPEVYVKELAENTAMLKSIKDFGQNNGQIYGECGGMMYLGKAIIDKDNEAFEMANYFDFETSIANKKLHLGYRTSTIGETIFKGHEFHYSSLVNDNETTIKETITNARGGETTTKIHKKNKVMGSYVHQYFGTSEKLLQLIKLIDYLEESPEGIDK